MKVKIALPAVELGVEPRGEWLRDRSGLDIREESAAT